MASKEELLEKLKEGVVEFEDNQVKEASQEWLDAGFPALDGIMDGLAAGMEIVGDLYERHEYFVPEVLMCADALYGGLDILRPHVPEKEGGSVGQVVIGSIQGDVHDIGKNLVKMMFDVAGWEVYDLGRDVPLENFVEEQLMKKVIKMIKEKNPNVAIMLGGAPVTQDVATLFGADGYAESAGNAVAEGIKMISRLRDYEAAKK
ncbi:MAG: B12-binding domain-containing protein [Deltaproteobacteria bacterium]|nr:B12-binding domain-containing protein [Deltaproteobacteria bacterium]